MEIKAEESSFEKVHIPEGIHHAEFVGVTDTPDGQYGPRVALDFVVHYSKTEKPAKIGRVLGKKLTPKAKLWEAFEALGGKPEVGKTFDTNALLGNPCRVVVEDYKDNDNKVVSGITKVKEPDTNTSTYLAEIKEKVSQGGNGDNNNAVPTEEVKNIS
jgi:hypothetical protein